MNEKKEENNTLEFTVLSFAPYLLLLDNFDGMPMWKGILLVLLGGVVLAFGVVALVALITMPVRFYFDYLLYDTKEKPKVLKWFIILLPYLINSFIVMKVQGII